MKKSFTLAFCIFTLSLIFVSVSCKGKASQNTEPTSEETSSSENTKSNSEETSSSENQAETQEVSQIDYSVFTKTSSVDRSLVKFYDDGKLLDTMYVSASSGLRIRKEPSTEAEVIGKIPFCTAVKVVAVGEKFLTRNLYWVKIVVPDYTLSSAETSYGWVSGEYLSPETPEFEKPETKEELSDYLCLLPTQFIDWGTDSSMFANDEHYLCFYNDGTAEYVFIKDGEDGNKITTVTSGTWEADSAAHVSINVEGFELKEINLRAIEKSKFDCMDSSGTEKIAYVQRAVYLPPHVSDKAYSAYKYAYGSWEMADTTFFQMNEDYYSQNHLNEMLVSGVDMKNTKYKENYKAFWDPIREKEKIQPLQIDMNGILNYSEAVADDSTAVGSYITLQKGFSKDIYRLPIEDEQYKIGTFKEGETGILKDVEYYSYHIPCPYLFYKIIDTATGVEGWVIDNYEPESAFLFTLNGTKDAEGNTHFQRVNADITFNLQKFDTAGLEDVSGLNFAHSGNIYGYEKYDNILLFRPGDIKPFKEIEIDSDNNDVDRYTRFDFNADDSKIYIAFSNGGVGSYDLNTDTYTEMKEISVDDVSEHFIEPKAVYVSPDEKTLYIKCEKHSYSRGVPAMIIYDIEKQTSKYFDLRTERDNSEGYYYYSPVRFNKDSQALYTMDDGDSMSVRISPESGPFMLSNPHEKDFWGSEEFFAPNGKDHILIANGNPVRLAKIDEFRELDEASYKYGFITDSHLPGCDNLTIHSPDGKMAAVVSENYYRYELNSIYVTVYSLTTLNQLFTFDLPVCDYPEFFWKGDSFIMMSKKGFEGVRVKLNIEEKKNQLCLSSKPGAFMNSLCQGEHMFAYDDDAMFNISFGTNGFYRITRYSNDEGGEVLDWVSGPYERQNECELVLYNATYFSRDPEGMSWDEFIALNKRHYMDLNIISKGGTSIFAFVPDETINSNIMCYELAK